MNFTIPDHMKHLKARSLISIKEIASITGLSERILRSRIISHPEFPKPNTPGEMMDRDLKSNATQPKVTMTPSKIRKQYFPFNDVIDFLKTH